MNNSLMGYKKLLLFIIILATVASFPFVPNHNSIIYNRLMFCVYLIMTILYFNIKSYENYFEFDTLFIVIYSIIAFAFPLFIFSESDPFKVFWGLSFNIKYISKGLYIALLGLSGYYTGSVFISTKDKISSEQTYIKTNVIIYLSFIFYALFFISGGLSYVRSIYLNDNGVIQQGLFLQFMSLSQACIICAIATQAYNYQKGSSKFNKFFILYCILFTVPLLLAGGRSMASFILLPILYWVIKNYFPMNLLKFCLFFVCAICIMWVFQKTRTGSAVVVEEGSNILSDLTIVSRATYTGIEIVDKSGFTWGKNMMSGVIGTIPSLERLLSTSFGVDMIKTGSAEIFTDYTFSDAKKRFGLGTNIFIDTYLSFGYIGTFLLMMILGLVIAKARSGISNGNYYSFIVYTAFFSCSVFYGRTAYTYPMRIVIWSLILAKLNSSIQIRRKSK
jgi:oligosaccharide repeat unit polymerase